MEWAERLGDLFPPDCLEVILTITGEEERQLILVGHGLRGEELLDSLQAVAQELAPNAK